MLLTGPAASLRASHFIYLHLCCAPLATPFRPRCCRCRRCCWLSAYSLARLQPTYVYGAPGCKLCMSQVAFASTRVFARPSSYCPEYFKPVHRASFMEIYGDTGWLHEAERPGTGGWGRWGISPDVATEERLVCFRVNCGSLQTIFGFE